MTLLNYKYVSFFSIVFLLFITSCYGKKQDYSNNKSVHQNISRVDSLRNLIISSNFPSDDIPKDKINILVDSQNGCVYLCKLFYETDGTGTVGWVEYDSQNKILKNVSPWLDKPEILSFDKRWSISNLDCLKSNRTDLPLPDEPHGLLYKIKKYPFCSRDYVENQKEYDVSNCIIPNYIVNFIDSLNYDSSQMNMIKIENEGSEMSIFIFEVFRGESTYFLIATIFDDTINDYKEIGYTGSNDLIFKDFCITRNLDININRIQYIYSDSILEAKDTLEVMNYKIKQNGKLSKVGISK